MNNKKLYALILTIITAAAMLLTGCGSTAPEETDWPAMESLRGIKAADITEISFNRATEGGVASQTVYDSPTIEEIYQLLTNVKLGKESDMATEDDGLGLTVKTADQELSFYFEGDIAVLGDKTRYEAENLGELKSYINSLAEKIDEANKKANSGSGDYDVMEGFQKTANGSAVYIYFNDFMMAMPNNEKYSFEGKGDSVTFYLFSAQQEGYGGRLVTIKAYDMDDDSYKNIPSYHVAGVGKNVNKRFIAIYPTDVQWNPNNSTMAEDYKELYAYVYKIGEGAVNSPLQTSDSN